VVRLESRPAGIEGVGEVTIRDLVRNALRMRPDRIVIGEVRGAEAMDLLVALNTGHRGALSTVHANGPGDALRRIETLAMMAGLGIPHEVVSEQLANAVDLVLHLERSGADRRAAELCEVTRVAGSPAVRSIWSRGGPA
jgi:pilus assembly protein CpaF